MDADYQKNALAPDQHHFEQSLFVLAGVMSAPVRERAIVDAGLKALRVRLGPSGRLRCRRADVREGLRRARRARRSHPTPGHRCIGDRLWLIPGHCDPTVNLYDWIVGARGTRVECVWPVAARGALG